MSVSGYQKPNIKTDFSRTPTWIYLAIVLILYTWGAFATIGFIFNPEYESVLESILDSIVAGISSVGPIGFVFLLFIVAFGAIFITFSVIMAYIIVWIMSKLAQEVTMVVTILFPLVLIAIGALMAGGGFLASAENASTISIIGIILAGFGALMLIFVIWKFSMIKRSGKFVEFSAQLVLDEKAVLAMPILLGIFSIITGFFMLFGFLGILDVFLVQPSSGDPTISPVGWVFAVIFEYFYLIVFLGVYYSLSAGVISYSSDWYRGLDPDLGSAMKDVRQIFPIIIKFALAMATVKIIIQIVTGAGRSQTRSGQSSAGSQVAGFFFAAIGGIFISILGAIWMFMNYFTLISMVQNKRGLKDSIKDSAKTTWNSLLDVLVGETGFGLTTFIFSIINALLWIIIGFSFGFLMGQDLVFGIVFAVVFFILGSVPYNIVTMPMKVAFRTFIYSYAKDSVEGFKKPSRLPAELRGEFKNLSSKRKKRGMRDPSQYF
ncbi:MAG: hypothetical protein ACXAC8_04830 [Candidatus Hodarchaeales archaeon]|jgi:hypothetical protein